MDTSKNIVDNFELLLEKQRLKKPPVLYNKVLDTTETTYKPQDVIETVYSQMKAIQKADCFKVVQSERKDLNMLKKSNFLTVNKLPVYHEVPKPNTNKFETQCVSDTQLINIIEGVEAIDTHSGMTQEFNTTFTQIEEKNTGNKENKRGTEFLSSIIENNYKISNLEVELSSITRSSQSSEEMSAERNTISVNQCNIEEDQNLTGNKINNKTQNTTIIHSQLSKTAAEDTITFIDDQIIRSPDEIKKIFSDTIEMEIDTGQDSQRSPSPVLNIKTLKRKAKSPPPLVVSLDSFENFENIALPLIEKNTDFKIAKYLINSQIIGKELCLNTHTNMYGIERNYSPILELKRDELQVNSQDVKPPNVKQISDDVVAIHDIKHVAEKRNESLKDEILFSSDEENDYIHKEMRDLPLTCAIDTSLYDLSYGVLEKSMYVGFQTASNKSIQISTDSFDKARSILENDDRTVENFSLTELVEKCDNPKHEKIINFPATTAVVVPVNETVKKIADEFKADLVNSNDSLKKASEEEKCQEECEKVQTKESTRSVHGDTLGPPEKQIFMGFVTASCKKIGMSDIAFQKCQKVFKDIDLNENFDAIEVNKDVAIVTKTSLEKTDTKGSYMANVEEHSNGINNKPDIFEENIIDDKINDELLLQEFENIEMSLEEKVSKTIDNDNVAFEGFKTANNKPIKISNEALAKTKSIFQDIDVEQEEQNNGIDAVVRLKAKYVSSLFKNASIAPGNVNSFKTASNKNVSISAEAFAKTRKLFQDIKMEDEKSAENVDRSDAKLEVETIKDINQPSTSKVVFVGFKTANNREIKISDEALSKSKDIFKDLDKRKSHIASTENASHLSTSGSEFIGFKTANNKDIKLSDDALSKSKNVFKDIDKELPTQSKSEDKDRFRGFRTASNKNVTISEQALTKSKKLFQDYDTTEIVRISKDIPEFQEKNPSAVFAGFKTANNNEVKICAEALMKSKKIFDGLDVANVDHKILPYAEDSKDINQIFEGFQTASKKPVSVSAAALAKSKIIFQNIDKVEEVPEKVTNSIPNIGFKGFQTADKKPVEVSKKAVTASKKLFDDLNAKEYSRNNFVGFKTASNKNVDISAEALAKCKKIFDDIEDIPITEHNPLKSKPKEDIFRGFQTGNNKEVDISKKALEKTKKLFEDIDSFPIPSFGGFQTAKNKKVTASEQALAKSRQLMLDIDSENDINISNRDNVLPNDNTLENMESKSNRKDMYGFKNGNNVNIKVSEDNLIKSKKLFDDITLPDGNNGTARLETKLNNGKDLSSKNDNAINIDGILNTQVLNNLEVNLCTQDFKDTPKPNKRSGSPILSCPRAKKRKKFETPYKSMPKALINFNKDEDKRAESNITSIFKRDYKKIKKYTLKDLTKGENEKNQIVDPYILNFNLENILDFEFVGERNDLTEEKMTIEEIKQLFTEGTDKKLIPDGWMDIHLKLILWKLISYEIKVINRLGKICTARNVIDQLKYRYDKELYNAERPILRKILEKDDVSTKPMVLCVAGIYVDGVSVASANNLANIELLLTDGWYFVRATIDKMLSKLVYDGKIAVGSKIVTCGAELMNCEEGVAPWEDTSSIRLHISGNSTRPARWDARLGLCPAAILNHLSAVKVNGGKICRLRVVVTRVYPLLYVEKFEDGSTVTRSERLEHLHQMKYEAEREAMIEKIYEEVQKTFSDQESQDSDSPLDSSSKRMAYDSGSQIAKLMKRSKDPMEFRAQLSSTQVQLLQNHASIQRDKYLQAVGNKILEKLGRRNVVTLARGRIAGLKRDGGKVAVTKGMLSIWKPNDAVLDIFKEGAWIEVMNVVPTALRNSEIQLSAGRQSMFRPLKSKNEETLIPYLETLKRICYNIKDLSQNPSITTDYNEIDTVGVIFSIDPPNREFESIKNQFQNVYLADVDKNMICVNFWSGIKKFGFENVLDTGQVLYCGNLQKRAGNTRKNIPQYRATEFSLFTKTPKNDKAREMVDEMNKKLFGLDRRKFCEDCVAVKQNYSVIKCFDSENMSPYRFDRSDYNLGKNKMFIETPTGVKALSKPDDFNLTGLDFESTFRQQESQELSPKSLERKKKVSERIAKLKMYGEPPPLSPINIINKSKNAANSYKMPFSNATTDVASVVNVATPINLPEDCAKADSVSPIMNRTYVKRVPVKLNFSGAAIEQNDSIDNFAEEFDGSPPLSLD